MKNERKVYLITIFVLLGVCTVLLVSSIAANAAGRTKLNKFDINENGRADIADVTSLLNYLAFGCEHQVVLTERIEPTCSTYGVMPYHVCSECGEKLDDVIYIDKLPHTVVVDAAIAPTCTEDGLTEGSHCSICGAVIKGQRTIAALGHDFGQWMKTTAATCTAAGEEQRTCNECGEIETRETEALGHNYENGVCTRCGKEIPLQKGDIYTFGAYEQDNDLTNGKEAIDWIVLDVQGEKALLLSCYVLEGLPYNETYVDVTWETCTLRTWLNETFYDEAFNSVEKSAIIQTSLENTNNPYFQTNGGKDTLDNIFVLSIGDIANPEYGFIKNFDALDEMRQSKPTNHAIVSGCWVYNTSYPNYDPLLDGYTWWWLRSPGNSSCTAARVCIDGSVEYSGRDINDYYMGVRPAIWINL